MASSEPDCGAVAADEFTTAELPSEANALLGELLEQPSFGISGLLVAGAGAKPEAVECDHARKHPRLLTTKK